LVTKSNNHFGIKCKSDWKGMSVSHTDDAPNECFRKYNDPADSYKDHSDFLRKSNRYSSLFSLDPTDYAGWAYGLKKAGYATNSKYPQIIIKLVEDYHLQDYSLIALGKLNPAEEIFAKEEQKNPEVIAADKMEDSINSEKPIVMEPEPEIIVLVKKPPKKNGPDQQAPVVVEKVKGETIPDYPEGEFKINETRVIYAKKGTPFLAIAEKYAIPLSRLFEFNDMKEEEVVGKDQLIFIMRKRKTGNNEQHIVKEGETLRDIAQTEAIRLESLNEYNFISPGMTPVPGTVLYLRAKAPSIPTLVSGK
jgi:Mannosyl-glycoprotein endo-beta-N-acetylglucosaminidase/LysM domain